MAQFNNGNRHPLLELDNLIGNEINIAYRELSELKGKNNISKNDFNYHRLNHIQNLFDEASVIIKNIDKNDTSGDLPAILGAQKHINENYGSFKHIQKIWKDVTITLDKDEYVLGRTFDPNNVVVEFPIEEPEDQNITEEIPEDFDEEAFLAELAAEKEEALAKAKAKKEKKVREKQRQEQQERFRTEGELREAVYVDPTDNHSADNFSKRYSDEYVESQKYSQQQIQEEAIQLGMRVDGEKSFSYADIMHEKYRQHDAETEAQNKAEEIRGQQKEAFDAYRQREAEILEHQSFGNQHLDFSAEFQKEKNAEKGEEYKLNNGNIYPVYSFAPSSEDNVGEFSVNKGIVSDYSLYRDYIDNHSYNVDFPYLSYENDVNRAQQHTQYEQFSESNNIELEHKKVDDIHPSEKEITYKDKRYYTDEQYTQYKYSSNDDYSSHKYAEDIGPEELKYHYEDKSISSREDYLDDSHDYQPHNDRKSDRDNESAYVNKENSSDRIDRSEHKIFATHSREAFEDTIVTGNAQVNFNDDTREPFNEEFSRRREEEHRNLSEYSKGKSSSFGEFENNKNSYNNKPSEQFNFVETKDFRSDEYLNRNSRYESYDPGKTDSINHKNGNSSWDFVNTSFPQRFDKNKTEQNAGSYSNGYKVDDMGRKKPDSNIYSHTGVLNNKQIYEAIEHQARITDFSVSKPVISAVYTDMLRRNVEAAHQHWKEVRGTQEEKQAIAQYREQRSILDKVKNDIRNNSYQIEKQEHVVETLNSVDHFKNRKDFSTQFSNYAPGKIVTEPSSASQGRAGVYTHADRSVPRNNIVYSKENPLMVSKEYKEAIYRRGREAQATFNHIVEMGQSAKEGPLKVSQKTASELTTSLDAFISFKRAENAGVVVVSENSKLKYPDYSWWQQRKQASYENNILSSDNKTGTNAYDKGILPKDKILNNKNKSDIDTVKNDKSPKILTQSKSKGQQGVFDHFNNRKSDLKDSRFFKTKALTRRYLKNIYVHTEQYSQRAFNSFRYAMYSVMQSGDDNALRTFERGRYYISSGLATANAIRNFHVVNSAKAGRFAERVDVVNYHKFNISSKKELPKDIFKRIETGKEQKESIKALMSKENFTVEDKMKLQAKIRAHRKDSKILKKEIAFQKDQFTNEMRIKVSKELEEGRRVVTTNRQIAKAMEKKTMVHKAKMEKKFGYLSKYSDKQVVNSITQLKLEGAAIKAKIKELEGFGSSLAPAQRQLLVSLKRQHSVNSLKLRKLIGLQRERQAIDLELSVLKSYGKSISKNIRGFRSGVRALSGFISKPFREGDVLAANGLYNAATFIANRHTRAIIVKSVKASLWVSARTIDAAFIVTGNNPIIWHNAVDYGKAKASSAVRKTVNTTKTAIKTVANETGKIAIKTAKATGNVIVEHTPVKVRTAVGKGTSGVKKTVRAIDRVNGSIRERYMKSAVHRGISRIRVWKNQTINKIRMIFSVGKAVLGKVALIGAGIYLLLVLIISIVGAFMSGSSSTSVIFSPYEGEKINLKPYVEILNEKQTAFDSKLTNIVQSKKYKGKTYDRVTINYATSTKNNFKEMLSMMAVRLGQDLSIEENPDVKIYLQSLYDDSHTLSSKESDYYSCSGCITRDYSCVEALPENASAERISLHNAYSSRGGCYEYKTYCQTTYEVENICDNVDINGNCAGHINYSCQRHTETVCHGKHIDLTISISVLGFDEIFAADSMGNAEVSFVAGEAIGTFKITHYCTCTICCGSGATGLTATGTRPKENHTIAVDKSVIPLGSKVVINGITYTAEDTGSAIVGNRIDIYMKNHQDALNAGTYNTKVYWPAVEGGSYQETGEWDGWTAENMEWAKLIHSPNWTEIYEGINDINGNIEVGELVVSGNWVWPVTSTTASSGFGWRDDPMNPGNPDFHKGTDIPIPEGTPVHAAGDGTVAAAHFSSSAGNMIIINHANGVVTKYYHNSQLLVSAGDTVTAGQVIALSGNTGNSTGPHLHFEFWNNGQVIDPRLQYGL